MFRRFLLLLCFLQLTLAGSVLALTVTKPHVKAATNGHAITTSDYSKLVVNATEDVQDDSPDEGESGSNHSKVFIFHHRSTHSAPFLTYCNLYLLYEPSFVKKSEVNNIVRAAVLPAYYNFLFRFSPF